MSQLRHNPANAVTQSIERIVEPDSRATVRKRLGRTKAGAAAHWQASDDPRHWNYWRREAEAYRSGALARSLDGTGLGRPDAECVDRSDGIELLLEYVDGRPGTEFGLADHVALATGLGRWQAAPPLDLPWTSTGFLRDYSVSRPAPDVLDDDAAWAHPLIADCLPPGLRAGWTRLTRSRDRLLAVMESLPRVTAHLDLWPANEIRRPGGEIVLLDWSFCGDGAVGEDVGNHVPDSVFDLFWPGERLAELDRAVYDAYVAGLREGGWTGDERLVRLGMVASCVKYTWILPVMLAVTGRSDHHAYHRPVDPRLLYTERGHALALLVAWCDEALALADALGR